ncbi:MAG: hypothetical protein LBQ86_04470, partial [Holophagales bacterium]|nr:hypothetical protein [Holophagales bacterium]
NGDYYAQIASFDGDQALGEYALYVTANAAELWTPENPEDWFTGVYKSHPIAPGRVASPIGGELSLHAQTRADAQSVDYEKIYYARFGQGGTGGAAGHWYKFTVPALGNN